MQPKKCYVEYVNDLPVAIHEIKTFTNEQEYKCFKETCDRNLAKLKKNESKKEELNKIEKERQASCSNKVNKLVAYSIYVGLIDTGDIQECELTKGLLTDILTNCDKVENYPSEYRIILERVERV